MSRLFAGLLLPVAGVLLAAPFALPDPLSMPGLLAGAGGLGLLAVAASLRFVSPQLGLGVVSSVYTLSLMGALLWSFSAEFRHQVRVWIDGPKAVRIWRTDDRYGYAHVPGRIGVHEIAQSFRVTYTIDEWGCRRTRDHPEGSDMVLFLGGSLTFGHGVEDDEAYPGILASKYWPRVKVRNRAASGWGTAQAYLALEDDLRQGLRPRVVLYGWNSDHVRRNYILRDWVAIMAKFGRKHPWFDIRNGALVFNGAIGADQSVLANPQTNQRAIDVTILLIEGMRDMAREAGAGFAMIRINWAGRQGVSATRRAREKLVLTALAQRGIELIDVRSVKGKPLPFDGHPDARWHAGVAALLARHPLLSP